MLMPFYVKVIDLWQIAENRSNYLIFMAFRCNVMTVTKEIELLFLSSLYKIAK